MGAFNVLKIVQILSNHAERLIYFMYFYRQNVGWKVLKSFLSKLLT